MHVSHLEDSNVLDAESPGHTLVSAWLRDLRTRQGMRLNHAAALSGLTATTVHEMETAGIRLVHHDVMKLLNVYRQGGTESGRTISALLTPDSTVRDNFPGWAARLCAAEHQAEAITNIANHCIPAPLQTPAYAEATRHSHRALMNHDQYKYSEGRFAPSGDLPPRYRVFLDQGVLARPYGGPAVMAEQIAHLERALTHGVDLRLITFDRPCAVHDETRLTFNGDRVLHPVETPFFTTYLSTDFADTHHRMALKVLDLHAASPRGTRALLEEARQRLQQQAAAAP